MLSGLLIELLIHLRRFECLSPRRSCVLRVFEEYIAVVLMPSLRCASSGGALLMPVECSSVRTSGIVFVVQVRSLLPVADLCAEVEKRNKLKLLDKFLKVLVEEGSQDPEVHNAMGKILIDANSNPEHFLQSNPFYQPAVVGKYCEKRCACCESAQAHFLCLHWAMLCLGDGILFLSDEAARSRVCPADAAGKGCQELLVDLQ